MKQLFHAFASRAVTYSVSMAFQLLPGWFANNFGHFLTTEVSSVSMWLRRDLWRNLAEAALEELPWDCRTRPEFCSLATCRVDVF